MATKQTDHPGEKYGPDDNGTAFEWFDLPE